MLFCLLNCQKQTTTIDRYDFPDVLNVKNVPDSTNDWSAFFFADMGAWFGFALPDSPEYYGSFIGPFSMRTQKWIGQDLIKFSIFSNSNEQVVFSNCKDTKIIYYPGILKQEYTFDDFEVELSLFYVSESEAIITSEIKNNSNATMQLSLGWEGELFDNEASFEQHKNQIKVIDAKDNYFGSLETESESIIKISNNKYHLKNAKLVKILPNNRHVENIIYHYSATETKNITNPREHYKQNQERWNSYIAAVTSPNTKWLQEKKYQQLAVKALETLILNWRSATGDLHHDGLFPSSSVWYFNGFWAWDSWKHAVALAKFAPELAKDQMRTMFDYQNEKGMIADCIYLDKSENNWRNSKPPLAAWAVWKIYQETTDKAFVQEMFPKLLKYHQWWYKYRDHDGDNLCEYGATDGTTIAAKWESGMDNAVRFDNSKILENQDNEWSLDQESVDLNAYLYAEKLFLAKMANLINIMDMATQLEHEANELKIQVQNLMFDTKSGFFYDINISSNQFLDTKGPEGWTPLFTGLATKEQAHEAVQAMCDKTEFATYIPFPTVSRKSPHFSTGYWRGTVWMDQACFGIMALREYGYQKEADKYTKQLFNRPEGLVNDDAPIRENYWSLDGKGMRANNFSWSAAHILMLLWEENFN